MSLWLQNSLVVLAVLVAAIYLFVIYIRGRRQPKCRDCGVFKAMDAASKNRPFPPVGKD